MCNSLDGIWQVYRHWPAGSLPDHPAIFFSNIDGSGRSTQTPFLCGPYDHWLEWHCSCCHRSQQIPGAAGGVRCHVGCNHPGWSRSHRILTCAPPLPFSRGDPLPGSRLPASTGTVPNQGEAEQGGGKREANPEDGHPNRGRERHERSNRRMETRERRIHGMTGWKTNKKRVDRHRAVPTNRRGGKRLGSI